MVLVAWSTAIAVGLDPAVMVASASPQPVLFVALQEAPSYTKTFSPRPPQPSVLVA